MVERQGKLDIARRIEEALLNFLSDEEKKQNSVVVFESTTGDLRAVVGSDKFKGKGPVERQEIVWDYLNKALHADVIAWLAGVQPRDMDEFRADKFRERSSTAYSTFVRFDPRRDRENTNE